MRILPSVKILPSVNESISDQISSLAELLFAFCALVWFLSTVGEHVSDYVIEELLQSLHLFGFSVYFGVISHPSLLASQPRR